LKLGKCRLCRPVRCSPTGGHKETSFQSPSGRGEKLVSLGVVVTITKRRGGGVGESLGPARVE